jgi:hypothetical protein
MNNYNSSLITSRSSCPHECDSAVEVLLLRQVEHHQNPVVRSYGIDSGLNAYIRSCVLSESPCTINH